MDTEMKEFVGKLDDGTELQLSVIEDVAAYADTVVDWMMDNGYADDIEDSVGAQWEGANHSPRYNVIAITPAREQVGHVFDALREDFDMVIQQPDEPVYPDGAGFRTPKEVIDSVEDKGLRLKVEAFAREGKDVPHRAIEEIPFGAQVQNREIVEKKLYWVADVVDEVVDRYDVESEGFAHHYFPGLKGEATIDEAFDDVENGISLFAGVSRPEAFNMSVGYLRPLELNDEYGGGSIEAPFFGYATQVVDEQYHDEAVEIAELLHESYNQASIQ